MTKTTTETSPADDNNTPRPGLPWPVWVAGLVGLIAVILAFSQVWAAPALLRPRYCGLDASGRGNDTDPRGGTCVWRPGVDRVPTQDRVPAKGSKNWAAERAAG